MNKQELFKDILRNLDAACNQPESDYCDGYCDALEMVLKEMDATEKEQTHEPDDARVERVAKRIVSCILADLKDRRGLRHEWGQIDDDIQEEIIETWEKAAIAAMKEGK